VAGLETRRLRGILTLTLVLTPLIILPTTAFKTANAQDRLTGWLYRRAIVVNNTGNPNTLVDYQVLVVVDTASLISAGKLQSTCADIRFTDEDGVTLLNYWIESGCNTPSTRIWVKVPSIPASSTKTIYLYYGNPVASSASDPKATFVLYDDFATLDSNVWYVVRGTVTLLNPGVRITGTGEKWATNTGGAVVRTRTSYGIGLSVMLKVDITNLTSFNRGGITLYIDDNNYVTVKRRQVSNTASWTMHFAVEASASIPRETNPYVNINPVWTRLDWYGNGVFDGYYSSDGVTWTKIDTYTYTAFRSMYIALEVDAGPGSSAIASFYEIRARKYIPPDPTTSVSAVEELIPMIIVLPNTSVIFRHMLVYSLNSTVFTHSFTATNTSTAGYETSYGGDRWAWRVYANPYTDPNTGETLANTASLVSNITIRLPYSTMLIEKLELYAKTNGTGSYRQLWVKILNSAGSAIAEVSNATMDVNWALTTISVNSLLSNNVTIWINATVTSTASVGEEICVTGVKLYMSYNATTYTVAMLARSDRHNVTTTFTVNLDTTLTNSSTIDLLIIDKLTYDSTDYPATPSYVGNETVNSNNYLVYRITGATSTGTYKAYSTIENAITKITSKSRGVEVTRVLIGEPVTVEIPVTGNISIPALNLEYINASSITIIFNETRIYTVVANATRPAEYILGYWSTAIVVDYGAFTASLNDVDGIPVDYETLDLTLVNRNTGESRSTRAKVSAYFTGLKHGVHELTARFKGIPVCYGTVDLYSATNASAVNLTCSLKRILDYRGLNRSLIFELGKQLVSFEDLSLKYPYSRIRVLLNGTGAFTLIFNYYGKKPTSVSVSGNVTITRWYWDGYYLVVTGTLGSLGEINITDLYKLRVEVYDRLGNLIPFNVPLYINDTAYYMPVVEGLFYPETYNITLPAEIYGFKFYGFSDNYSDVARLINVSISDVVLKAYYRVPSKVEVKAYQVSSLIEAVKRLLALSSSDKYVGVFFEGKLLDYYGGGVSGRTLTVRLYRAGSLVAEYNVTTDSSGYWRTPTLQLIRGETYTVSTYYAGDEVYVESGAVYEFSSEALPPAPTPAAPPLETLVIVAGALLLVGLILAVVHAVRHTVVELEEERRFVKRKQL
jgi:hypothetical protein